MISVEEAVEKLKDIISQECQDEKNGRVFDKHVAKQIGLETSKLRSYIYKDNLPILEITMFLLSKNINVNEFFSKKFEAEEVLNND